MRRRSKTAILAATVCALIASALAYQIMNAGATSPDATGALAQLSKGWPKDKLALIHQEEALQEKARRHPAPKLSRAAALAQGPATIAPPKRRAQIYNMHDGALPPGEFWTNNMWQGPLKGRTWVLLDAGEMELPTHYAAVYVILETREPNGQFALKTVGAFAAPAGTGSLTVVGWQGDVVSLRSAHGRSLQFNIATDTFSG